MPLVSVRNIRQNPASELISFSSPIHQEIELTLSANLLPSKVVTQRWGCGRSGKYPGIPSDASGLTSGVNQP